MKKIIIITSGIVLGLIMLLAFINYKNVPGEFLFRYIDDNNYGFTIYTPTKIANNNNVILDGNIYNALEYNKNKTKVLALKSSNNSKSNKYTICEINLKTKQNTPIIQYKAKNEKTVYFSNIKYVPNKNAISYKRNNSLYVYNLKNENKDKIISFKGQYSWSKDGNSLIYSTSVQNKIFKYNLKDKSNKYLFKGFSPIYSNDNNYIAYKESSNAASNLVVKNLKTQESWTYAVTDEIWYYKFSPNDKYIAILQDNNQAFVPNGAKQLKIWNYKNNQVSVLKEFTGDCEFDWE